MGEKEKRNASFLVSNAIEHDLEFFLVHKADSETQILL